MKDFFDDLAIDKEIEITAAGQLDLDVDLDGSTLNILQNLDMPQTQKLLGRLDSALVNLSQDEAIQKVIEFENVILPTVQTLLPTDLTNGEKSKTISVAFNRYINCFTEQDEYFDSIPQLINDALSEYRLQIQEEALMGRFLNMEPDKTITKFLESNFDGPENYREALAFLLTMDMVIASSYNVERSDVNWLPVMDAFKSSLKEDKPVVFWQFACIGGLNYDYDPKQPFSILPQQPTVSQTITDTIDGTKILEKVLTSYNIAFENLILLADSDPILKMRLVPEKVAEIEKEFEFLTQESLNTLRDFVRQNSNAQVIRFSDLEKEIWGNSYYTELIRQARLLKTRKYEKLIEEEVARINFASNRKNGSIQEEEIINSAIMEIVIYGLQKITIDKYFGKPNILIQNEYPANFREARYQIFDARNTLPVLRLSPYVYRPAVWARWL